ncbi:hypothetical protein [uncultured Lutibacter sp.]|nr:hypothetical protein [uncultured Lutibacter sp.]
MKAIKRAALLFILKSLIELRDGKEKEGNSLNIDIHGMDDYFYYRSNRH